MQSAEPKPVVASYVPVYCKPEMLHVHRQITGLQRWQAHVVTQRRENEARLPLPDGTCSILPKYRWRFFRRLWFHQIRRVPWVASKSELEAMRRIVAERQARAIHLYFGHIALQWLPLLRRPPVPVVVSFHGADAGHQMDNPAYNRRLREVFSLSSRVLARSHALLDRLADLGCPTGKLALNRTGIPLEAFPCPVRQAPAGGRWILLQSGRLIPKKGHATSLQVLHSVRRRFPHAVLRVAGDGPLLGILRDEASALGLENAIEWLGFLSPDALRAELQAAHIFLHPSETTPDGDREGVPNALLEAMACGLPVLATRHGGIPEAVQSGESGWLAPEKDSGELAAAAIRMMDNPDLWAAWGSNARLAVGREFSQSAAIRSLEAIYDEIAGH